MTHKINICDLSLGQLNGPCLVKINRYARELKRRQGVILKLQDDNLIKQMVKSAKRTDDQALKELYSSVKQEIKKHINSPGFIRYNDSMDELHLESVNSYLSTAPSLGKL